MDLRILVISDSSRDRASRIVAGRARPYTSVHLPGVGAG
jgi:hypothetical protein